MSIKRTTHSHGAQRVWAFIFLIPFRMLIDWAGKLRSYEKKAVDCPMAYDTIRFGQEKSLTVVSMHCIA